MTSGGFLDSNTVRDYVSVDETTVISSAGAFFGFEQTNDSGHNTTFLGMKTYETTVEKGRLGTVSLEGG